MLGLGAAAGFGGDLLNWHGNKKANEMNRDMARETNALNSVEAQKNRDFQAEMSNTGHQRAVKDLKEAGLNPLLAANSSASTPSGSQATASPGNKMENETAGMLTGAFSSAMEARKMQLTASQVKADNDLKAKQGVNADANTALSEANAAKSLVEAKVAAKGIPAADAKNRIYKMISPILDKVEEGYNSSARDSGNNPAAAAKVKEYQKKYQQRPPMRSIPIRNKM